jgi:hypothetical protein
MQLLKMRGIAAVSCGVLMTVFVLSGCGGDSGPELGTVKGKVTSGGQPLANATVTFVPAGQKGTTASGQTGADGTYELAYSLSRKGCEPGSYSVTITTASEDEDGNVTEEKVPAKYNASTELKAEVKSGSNTLDFALEAGSPAAKPAKAAKEE